MRLHFGIVSRRQRDDRISNYHQCRTHPHDPHHFKKPRLGGFGHYKDPQDTSHLAPRNFFPYKPLPQTIMQLAESKAGEKIGTRSVAASFAIGLFGSFYETLLCLSHPRKFFSDLKTVAHAFFTKKSFRTDAEIFLANGLAADVAGWLGSAIFGAIGATYNLGLAVAGTLLGDTLFSTAGAHLAWFLTCYRIWASPQKELSGKKERRTAALDLEKQILHSLSRNLAIAMAFLGGAAIAMGAVGLLFGAGIAVIVNRALDIPSTIAYRAATVAPNSKFIALIGEKRRRCNGDGGTPASQE